MRRFWFSVPVLAALAACATAHPVQTANSAGSDRAASKDAPRAAKGKIPVVLKEAQADPYARPNPLTCPALAAQLGRLDDALGPDIDVKKPPAKHTVAGAAAAAAKDVTEGLIPMQSWVRYMTGAQGHDEAVKAALTAGVERRAYLKGLAQSLGCIGLGPKPTHPFPAPPPTPSLVVNAPLAAKP
jgi:hypothetical protein